MRGTSAFKQITCKSIVTVRAESGVARVSSLSLIVAIRAASVDCTPSYEIEAICQDLLKTTRYLPEVAHSAHDKYVRSNYYHCYHFYYYYYYYYCYMK